jgi:2-methylcitrate dehydratase
MNRRRDFLHLAVGGLALQLPTLVAAAPATRAPLAERLAAYAAALSYEDLDAETIERVKAHLIDTLGCGIAAFNEEPVRTCREVALTGAASNSIVLGTSKRTSPDLASFANGAAFRFYDLNDSYVGRPTGHPSDNIAPCLAVAESERASGADLIVAIVLAYEVNCRLIDAFDMTTRGWDAPVFSLPAVALAVGKLMKLPAPKLAQAVNLALNDHIAMGQTRAQELSDWKGLSDAEASRNAVFAATLARAGITGPAPIFEGERGFFQLVSGAADVDVDAFGKRGVEFRINQCSVKAYPAVVYAQTAIVAGIAVAKEAGNLDRISAIEIAVTARAHRQAGSGAEKWAPANRATADHSLPYITARAMVDGEISNESYTPAALSDPRILAFMRKITVKEDPTMAASGASAPPTRVTATLGDGRRITRQVEDIPGFGGKPAGRSETERKFRANAGKSWPQERTDAIVRALWELDRASDLAPLLGKLSLQAQIVGGIAPVVPEQAA